jgi:hypothetical protein
LTGADFVCTLNKLGEIGFGASAFLPRSGDRNQEKPKTCGVTERACLGMEKHEKIARIVRMRGRTCG